MRCQESQHVISFIEPRSVCALLLIAWRVANDLSDTNTRCLMQSQHPHPSTRWQLLNHLYRDNKCNLPQVTWRLNFKDNLPNSSTCYARHLFKIPNLNCFSLCNSTVFVCTLNFVFRAVCGSLYYIRSVLLSFNRRYRGRELHKLAAYFPSDYSLGICQIW